MQKLEAGLWYCCAVQCWWDARLLQLVLHLSIIRVGITTLGGMVTMTIGFTIIRVAVTTDMTIEKSSRHGGIVSTTINNSQSKTKLKIGKMAI